MSFGLGRSNSLSINTGGGSLFGNNATATTGASQPQSGGLFGASTTAPAPSQPQSGSLFGNMNKPATTGTTGGGLFGSSTTATQQPQTGSSLFGGALGGATQQNQGTATQAGGLFGGLGGSTAQTQTQTQAKPSLFGASTNTNTQQSSTPSLFGGAGNTTAQNQTTSTPSLFGATTTQQPQQQAGSSLFGSAMPAQNTGLGATQSSQSGLQIKSLDSIRSTTRFNDLHPEIQNMIQDVDNRLQERMQLAEKCGSALPGQAELVATLGPDVAYIEQLLATVELGLDNDSQNIARLKELVAKDEQEQQLVMRAITNQSLPQVYHYRGVGGGNLGMSTSKPAQTGAGDNDDESSKPVDLVGYFSRRADDMGATLDMYQRQIREIEAHLRTMEAGTVEKAQQLTGNRSAARDQKRELSEALRAIGGAINDTAVKVHQAKDAVIQQTVGSAGAGVL